MTPDVLYGTIITIRKYIRAIHRAAIGGATPCNILWGEDNVNGSS